MTQDITRLTRTDAIDLITNYADLALGVLTVIGGVYIFRRRAYDRLQSRLSFPITLAFVGTTVIGAIYNMFLHPQAPGPPADVLVALIASALCCMARCACSAPRVTGEPSTACCPSTSTRWRGRATKGFVGQRPPDLAGADRRRARRERYLEQWLADGERAAELDISSPSVAFGVVKAAVAMNLTRRSAVALGLAAILIIGSLAPSWWP
ncbi:hypothetical protein [Nonomuraea sp. NPDC049158]|uniref:hypothetical protein n=1 Tax=Nonomuraea sp. NPDC049158 TaxID=3155649 RepID=UPI0033CE346A